RRRADMMLVNLNGVYGTGDNVAAKFSNNNGQGHTGGTCFGDSGGPILVKGSDTMVAVTSFGLSVTCSDGTGGYRVDQPDDLEFLASFGLTP
ncbi:MAG: trypsin-like serine protease, partial [Actinomycetota bacterium]|nr:trypsin-like serine protease [Actinomycetota bacterium]